MKSLAWEGEPLVAYDNWNGTNPDVFKEFADANGYDLDTVVEVYRENEAELEALYKEYER